MYAIKNFETGKFVKHTDETVNNEGYEYVSYPWKLVEGIEGGQQYETLEHANEVAFWSLDSYETWVLVNVETGEEYQKKTGKYLPV